MKKKYMIFMIIICLNIILVSCTSLNTDEVNSVSEAVIDWRQQERDVFTYGYYGCSSLQNNNKLGLCGQTKRPYAVGDSECSFTLIDGKIYVDRDNKQDEIYSSKDMHLILVGQTDEYLYAISGLLGKYTLYRYSMTEGMFEQIYSSAQEKQEYNIETIGKYIWIDGENCLLTTIESGTNNAKSDYTALYIFNDEGEYERYEVRDDTVELNDKYLCQKVEDVQFITDVDHNWYVECSGTNDRGNVIVCNGKVFESGQEDSLSGYEIEGDRASRICAYSWYINAYSDTVITFITGGIYYQNHFSDVINTSTNNWRYDAIDIYDTTSDERYTLYEDGTNRIIGYDPKENRVFLYVYSDNTFISKDLDDDTLVSLESFEEAAAISFVWEGKDLFYFYGTGDDMRYGGIIDVAK